MRESVILVMGVCGTGKTTVARSLAEAFGGAFVEADDLHPPRNIELMSSGTPLTDADRWPWLHAVCDAAQREGADRPVAIACSALKRSYRDLMRARLGPMSIVHLVGEPALIRARMEARQDHYMRPGMLDSQLATLEPPGSDEGAIVMDIVAPVADVAARAERALRDPGPGSRVA